LIIFRNHCAECKHLLGEGKCLPEEPTSLDDKISEASEENLGLLEEQVQ